jgi:hypothetical protein
MNPIAATNRNRGSQLSLFDLGPARQPAPADFWAREREDREDNHDMPRDDADEE